MGRLHLNRCILFYVTELKLCEYDCGYIHTLFIHSSLGIASILCMNVATGYVLYIAYCACVIPGGVEDYVCILFLFRSCLSMCSEMYSLHHKRYMDTNYSYKNKGECLQRNVSNKIINLSNTIWQRNMIRKCSSCSNFVYSQLNWLWTELLTSISKERKYVKRSGYLKSIIGTPISCFTQYREI